MLGKREKKLKRKALIIGQLKNCQVLLIEIFRFEILGSIRERLVEVKTEQDQKFLKQEYWKWVRRLLQYEPERLPR